MTFLTRILLGLALVPCLTAAPPNVLLIFADDLGFGDVGCYNPETKVDTPHLDQLANEGLRFTDAHSPSTVCTPSRYSLLTGRMAFRIPYRGVFTGAGGPCLIEEGRLTMPAMLREKGYRTALFGKWHIGMTFFDKEGKPIHKDGLEPVRRIDYGRAIRGGPVDHGFDVFFGTACCPTTDWLYAFIANDRIPVPPEKLLDRSTLPEHPWSFDCREGLIAPDFDMEEIDEIFLKRSITFLEEHAKEKPEQPFFLMHSTQAVHLPSFPSKRFKGTTGKGAHGDFIAQFDGHVGDLMAALERLDLAKNTIVLVTSDNGPEVGTVIHMRGLHDHDGARPWRGVKRDNWEGGHRVPLLVRWPGVSPAGVTVSRTMCLTDFFATFAEMAGYELPDNAAEDSVSLLPILKGRDEPVRDYTLHQTWSLDLAIRQGPWKYLDHKGSGGNRYDRKGSKNWSIPQDWIIEDNAPETPGQLYDLATDPGETVNLIKRHPERAAELKELLEASKKAGRTEPFAESKR